uniref:intramembrane prenyl-peptidase Rce1 n=1 Tax=Chenopodium quinoa TaxID=63459 RepID=A0A803MQF1_CHEQI
MLQPVLSLWGSGCSLVEDSQVVGISNCCGANSSSDKMQKLVHEVAFLDGYYMTSVRNLDFLSLAPITEELVFRACMIPLLLCGGFKVQAVLLLCPMFFSLGTQLAYTMIFGSYASFLFIRSGHLSAPLVAHIVCNYMGLPAVYARRKGVVVSLAFISGTMAFVRLLFPLTSPALYNNRTDNCRCWHGYCSWS